METWLQKMSVAERHTLVKEARSKIATVEAFNKSYSDAEIAKEEALYDANMLERTEITIKTRSHMHLLHANLHLIPKTSDDYDACHEAFNKLSKSQGEKDFVRCLSKYFTAKSNTVFNQPDIRGYTVGKCRLEIKNYLDQRNVP